MARGRCHTGIGPRTASGDGSWERREPTRVSRRLTSSAYGGVTIGEPIDVAEKPGQLRLMVGAHPFAGGAPFGLGAHDLGRYRVPTDPARAARALAVAGWALVACCR